MEQNLNTQRNGETHNQSQGSQDGADKDSKSIRPTINSGANETQHGPGSNVNKECSQSGNHQQSQNKRRFNDSDSLTGQNSFPNKGRNSAVVDESEDMEDTIDDSTDPNAGNCDSYLEKGGQTFPNSL